MIDRHYDAIKKRFLASGMSMWEFLRLLGLVNEVAQKDDVCTPEQVSSVLSNNQDAIDLYNAIMQDKVEMPSNQKRLSILVPDRTPKKLAELAGSQKNMGKYITDLVERLYDEKHKSPKLAEVQEPVSISNSDLELYKAATQHLLDRVKALELRLNQLDRRG